MAVQDHVYSVRGRWPFPADMLRRDGSRPLTPDDGGLVESLSGETCPDDLDREVEIRLVIPEAEGRRQNTERWESFGWTVPSDLEHAADRAMRDRDEARDRRLDGIAQAVLARLSDEEREALSRHYARQHGL